jgi:hypothetical protein
MRVNLLGYWLPTHPDTAKGPNGAMSKQPADNDILDHLKQERLRLVRYIIEIEPKIELIAQIAALQQAIAAVEAVLPELSAPAAPPGKSFWEEKP